MKRYSLATLAAAVAVAIIAGVKFSARIRPQLAKVPGVGKYLV